MFLRSFLPLLAVGLVSCRTKPQNDSQAEGLANSATLSQKAPQPPPPAPPSPEELARPAAGLEVTYRGVSLSEAKNVVILFHGYGADSEDLADLAEVMTTGDDSAFVFPQAPLSLPVRGYAWFARDRSDFENGYLRARAFVAWVIEQAPQAELLVGGFSQGAILTANLVADLPPQTRAALLFSPADLLVHAPTSDTRKVPLFVSHGSQDAILPFSGAKNLHDRFQRLGFDVTWQPFVGRHTISAEVLMGLNTFLASLPAR